MVQRKPPSNEELNRAAELRAGGASWERVAQELGRSAAAVRRWPITFARRWRDKLVRAERRLLAEATAEAIVSLRAQLRSSDARIARDAAQKLIQLRIAFDRRRSGGPRRRPPPPLPTTDARRIAQYLGTLSDAELQATVQELAGSGPLTASEGTSGPEGAGEGGAGGPP